MSKAFTKESDGDEDDDLPEDMGGLPISAKNYMTPEGFARLRGELDTLMRKERPDVVKVVSWAAGNGDRSENGDYIYGKKRLREIDRRVRYLSKRLANAEVVDPAKRAKTDQVFFGATVTTANAQERGAHHQDRRRRRGRPRQGPRELDLAHRQGAAARRGRRCREDAHAGRRGGDRDRQGHLRLRSASSRSTNLGE